MAAFPKLSTIVGGVSSGKSSFAERLVVSAGLNKVYLATAETRDDEMRARVERHVRERGPAWQLFEEPREIGRVLNGLSSADICLLDCATMWLSNQVEQGHGHEVIAPLIADLEQAPCPVVIVTNELGLGGIAGTPLARTFADLQGRLNAALMGVSDLGVAVLAGQPVVLKGRVPDHLS